MKRIVAFLLSVALVLGLIACDTQTNNDLNDIADDEPQREQQEMKNRKK
jgi:Ni/Co efflux regulator RcnB